MVPNVTYGSFYGISMIDLLKVEINSIGFFSKVLCSLQQNHFLFIFLEQEEEKTFLHEPSYCKIFLNSKENQFLGRLIESCVKYGRNVVNIL